MAVNYKQRDVKLAEREGTKLNDEVINFAMRETVVKRARNRGVSIFTHSSFFYTLLENEGFKSIFKWTKDVDIFSKDFVFIPLNKSDHWTIVIIDNEEKRIEFYDSLELLDAIEILRRVERYLLDEWRAKKKGGRFPDYTLHDMSKGLKKQPNLTDCGVYTYLYANYRTSREHRQKIQDISQNLVSDTRAHLANRMQNQLDGKDNYLS